MPVALGFRVHSGWAAVVVLSGEPAVLDRRHIDMTDPGVRGAKQPYHAAEGMPLVEARRIIEQAKTSAERLAAAALDKLLDELRTAGHSVGAAGLLLGSGRRAPSLEATLSSHAMIHTMEGELFRDAIRAACDGFGIPLVGVREKEILAQAAAVIPVPDAPARVTALGRGLGPPWQKDEKLCALVAWIAIVRGDRC